DDEWTRFDASEQPKKSPAFAFHVDELWPGGPGYLAAFGMGGIETLVWVHKLTIEYPHLLCRSPFIMAELTRGKAPTRPQTTAFIDPGGVEIPAIADPTPADTPTMPRNAAGARRPPREGGGRRRPRPPRAAVG